LGALLVVPMHSGKCLQQRYWKSSFTPDCMQTLFAKTPSEPHAEPPVTTNWVCGFCVWLVLAAARWLNCGRCTSEVPPSLGIVALSLLVDSPSFRSTFPGPSLRAVSVRQFASQAAIFTQKDSRTVCRFTSETDDYDCTKCGSPKRFITDRL
jgi:hypothetical protein